MTDEPGAVIHATLPDPYAINKAAFQSPFGDIRPPRGAIAEHLRSANEATFARLAERRGPPAPLLINARGEITAPPAPPTPIAPAEGADPRDALRLALAEKAEAEFVLAEARGRLGRADDIVRDAQHALDRTVAAEKVEIAAQGAALAAWIAGGEGPRPQAVANGHDRADAAAALAAAVAARAALAADVERAAGRSNGFELRIVGAVERIVVEAATDDVDRLAALMAAAAELSARLGGVATLTLALPGAYLARPVKLPPPVMTVIRDSGATPTPAARSLWQQFADRLREDPDATLVASRQPEPEPPQAA